MSCRETKRARGLVASGYLSLPRTHERPAAQRHITSDTLSAAFIPSMNAALRPGPRWTVLPTKRLSIKSLGMLMAATAMAAA